MSVRRQLIAGTASVASAAALGLGAPGLASASPAAPTTQTGGVAQIPVSFQVTDSNHSQALCAPLSGGNGKTYTVRGHLTEPSSAVGKAVPVVLYKHGHGTGEWFWNFDKVSGYNYAKQMAQKGFASVTVDKLGYGDSGKPPGDDVCYGTEATVSHEIIQDLRTGNYHTDSGSPVSFQTVGLAGAAQSAFDAEAEEYSFHDVDALMLFGFVDGPVSPALLTNYGINFVNCAVNPLHQDGSDSPGGYQYRERTDKQYIADDFYDADPTVEKAATKMRSKDPCGYPFSAPQTLLSNNFRELLTPDADTPLLSVTPDHDGNVVSALAPSYKNLEFARVHDKTVTTLNGTGTFFTLGHSAGQFRSLVANWLDGHDFTIG
jgi:hypothetical protein